MPDRIADYQPQWQQEVFSFYAVPGSKIKAGDLLEVNDLGSVRVASSGGWPFGYAVSSADADGRIRVCGDPRMVEWPTA